MFVASSSCSVDGAADTLLTILSINRKFIRAIVRCVWLPGSWHLDKMKSKSGTTYLYKYTTSNIWWITTIQGKASLVLASDPWLPLAECLMAGWWCWCVAAGGGRAATGHIASQLCRNHSLRRASASVLVVPQYQSLSQLCHNSNL